jgi:hypothetical protein
MSVAVGTIAFCLTVPIVLVLGGMLFGSLGLLDGEGLIPAGFAILFLVAILVGPAIGILVGIKYFRYIETREG